MMPATQSLPTGRGPRLNLLAHATGFFSKLRNLFVRDDPCPHDVPGCTPMTMRECEQCWVDHQAGGYS